MTFRELKTQTKESLTRITEEIGQSQIQFNLEESPIGSGCKYVELGSTFKTAKSKSASVPIILAMYDSPSRNVTVTFPASSTT